jgi:hypothetical protein
LSQAAHTISAVALPTFLIDGASLDRGLSRARRVAKDPKELMPPPATTKKLTQEQKVVLQRWINDGAPYQPHWSLIAPKRTELPSVQDTAWIRNPIDRFLLTKLEAKN